MTGTTDRDYLKGNENLPGLKLPEPTPDARSWLVLINCSMDDIPVRMFDTQDDADAFIKANPPYPNEADEINHPDLNNAYKVNDVDVGIVHGYSRLAFVNGVPTEKVRFFWDDQDCPWKPADGWVVDDWGNPQQIPGPDACEPK